MAATVSKKKKGKTSLGTSEARGEEVISPSDSQQDQSVAKEKSVPISVRKSGGVQEGQEKGNSISLLESGLSFPPNVVLNKSGAEFPADMSFDEWEDFGTRLVLFGEVFQWVVVDWINYGEKHWGEKYKEVVNRTGKTRETLMNWVSVDNRISRRRETLSFTHHEAVAVLPHCDQDEILEMAERKHWSVRQVREQVRQKKKRPVEESINGHPELKKLNSARAYLGRVQEKELGRMNEGERTLAVEALEWMTAEISKRLDILRKQ